MKLTHRFIRPDYSQFFRMVDPYSIGFPRLYVCQEFIKKLWGNEIAWATEIKITLTDRRPGKKGFRKINPIWRPEMMDFNFEAKGIKFSNLEEHKELVENYGLQKGFWLKVEKA